MNTTFTNWTHWKDRNRLPDSSSPGVYAIAISATDISSIPFSWIPEIVYIGMTNSKGGLTSRLGQFDNTIKGRKGHGGGHRVRYKHQDYSTLTPMLYVSVCAFKCDVVSEDPHNLRIMGEVAKYEYECFALFAEKFGQLPEFNDKKRSPKK